MSNQIKFRAWDSQKMLYNVGYHPSLLKTLVDDEYGYKENDEGAYIICPKFISYKLMQYSNWNDKNNKEIYEGDILQCINADGELITVVCEFGKAVRQIFENEVEISGFYLKNLKTNKKTFPITSNYLGKHDLEILEIIGNIYENKSLLNEKEAENK